MKRIISLSLILAVLITGAILALPVTASASLATVGTPPATPTFSDPVLIKCVV